MRMIKKVGLMAGIENSCVFNIRPRNPMAADTFSDLKKTQPMVVKMKVPNIKMNSFIEGRIEFDATTSVCTLFFFLSNKGKK